MSERRKGLGGRYKRLRLAQGAYFCDGCGLVPPPYPSLWSALLHAHHIVPLWIGGEDAIDNLALLCLTCHVICHDGNQQPGEIPAPLTPSHWLGARTIADLRREFRSLWGKAGQHRVEVPE